MANSSVVPVFAPIGGTSLLWWDIMGLIIKAAEIDFVRHFFLPKSEWFSGRKTSKTVRGLQGQHVYGGNVIG